MASPGARRDAVALLVWALLASLCLRHVAHAGFVVETNALHISGAPDLKLDGDYEAAIGNFGVPQYGGRLRGMVVYPDANQEGCQLFPGDGHMFSPQRGVAQIVLLNRGGGCYFMQKIYNAQQAGASAVIVVDDRDEQLITMDVPADEYTPNITIPSAFIQLSLGKKIKEALQAGKLVQVVLEWDLPHPDNRVEWELWGNSNQACGPKCDAQIEFIKAFNAVASSLEQGKFTLFTPHYITWYCPAEYLGTLPCDKQCIRNGRYCTPDPDGDFEAGYDGRDVVLENLRQLCVFQQANTLSRPWLWWSYVNDFNDRCKMTDLNFNASCAEEVIRAIGLDVAAVNACIGDPDLDQELDLLNKEQDAQVGKDGRSDVTILPTIVINEHQYRGQLDKSAVQKAICAGFSETTEPPACLTPDIQTNDCEVNNGGCWSGFNFTACKDTFRGKVCECPTVGPYTFRGDGYSFCEPVTGTRCELNNGGCWSFTQGNNTWSACKPEAYAGCECPSGFQGDGTNCNDINECDTMCRCKDCKCENTIGSFTCSCKSGAVYHRSTDTCGNQSDGMSALGVMAIVLACLAVLAGAGYVVYKYRVRQYMDSEIRAIMSQYMPLDAENQPANQATRGEGQPLNNI